MVGSVAELKTVPGDAETVSWLPIGALAPIPKRPGPQMAIK